MFKFCPYLVRLIVKPMNVVSNLRRHFGFLLQLPSKHKETTSKVGVAKGHNPEVKVLVHNEQGHVIV
jgi:hypothetical protein